MPESELIYSVVIESPEVRIEKLDRSDKNFGEARDKVILRERDAIEICRNNEESNASQDGVYYFLSLDNARSFALLQLKIVEQAIADNLDRIQNYA